MCNNFLTDGEQVPEEVFINGVCRTYCKWQSFMEP